MFYPLPRNRVRNLLMEVILIFLFTALCHAVPHVSFPFNQQLPPVARIGQPYYFQFAPSTFLSDGQGILNYTLLNPPDWINLDSQNRILSGTPTGPEGNVNFILSASDSSGRDTNNCQLFVTRESPPQIVESLDDQLYRTAQLSGPATVMVGSGQSFDFSFSSTTFGDLNLPSHSPFRATLSDRTPLPSWIRFNSSSLRFHGIAPTTGARFQEYSLLLILTKSERFAIAESSFTVVTGPHTLAFNRYRQTHLLSSASTRPVSIDTTLLKNGKRAELSKEQVILSATTPSWLSFNNGSLELTLPLPEPIPSGGSVTVIAQDALGAKATAMVDVRLNSKVFTKGINEIQASRGQRFEYKFRDNLFLRKDVELEFFPSESWIHFNPKSRRLFGSVPQDYSFSTIPVKLVARLAHSSFSEELPFEIQISDLGRGTEATGKSKGPDVVLSQTNSRKTLILAVVLALSVPAIAFVIVSLWCRATFRGPWKRRKMAPLLEADESNFFSSDVSPVITFEDEEEKKFPPPSPPAPGSSAPQIKMDIAVKTQGHQSSWPTFYPGQPITASPSEDDITPSATPIPLENSQKTLRESLRSVTDPGKTLKPVQSSSPNLLFRPSSLRDQSSVRSKSGRLLGYTLDPKMCSTSFLPEKVSRDIDCKEAANESNQPTSSPAARESVISDLDVSPGSGTATPAYLRSARAANSPFFAGGGISSRRLSVLGNNQRLIDLQKVKEGESDETGCAEGDHSGCQRLPGCGSGTGSETIRLPKGSRRNFGTEGMPCEGESRFQNDGRSGSDCLQNQHQSDLQRFRSTSNPTKCHFWSFYVSSNTRSASWDMEARAKQKSSAWNPAAASEKFAGPSNNMSTWPPKRMRRLTNSDHSNISGSLSQRQADVGSLTRLFEEKERAASNFDPRQVPNGVSTDANDKPSANRSRSNYCMIQQASSLELTETKRYHSEMQLHQPQDNKQARFKQQVDHPLQQEQESQRQPPEDSKRLSQKKPVLESESEDETDTDEMYDCECEYEHDENCLSLAMIRSLVASIHNNSSSDTVIFVPDGPEVEVERRLNKSDAQ